MLGATQFEIILAALGSSWTSAGTEPTVPLEQKRVMVSWPNGILSLSRLRGMILLLSSELVSPHMECVLASKYKRDMATVKKVQWKITKMMKALEHLSYEQRLKQLGPFSLEKWIFGASGVDLITVINRREAVKKREPCPLQWFPVTGQEVICTKWKTSGSFHPKHSPTLAPRKLTLSQPTAAHPWSVWSFPFWWYSKAIWTCSWATRSRLSFLS